MFTVFSEDFTKTVFICGFKYTRQRKEKSQLFNFVLGEAKMTVHLIRRRITDGGEIISPVLVTVGLIRSRIRLDYNHYKLLGDLILFEKSWYFQSVLRQIQGDDLIF